MIPEDNTRQAHPNKYRVGAAWSRMQIDIDASITWYLRFHYDV